MLSDNSGPKRVLSFAGTRTQFVAYLIDLIVAQHPALVDADPEAYEWELTASIARHPAGKGLSSGE